MIDINVKIHDKYSVEFKIGLKVKYPNLEKFAVNTWIFVPNSLDIDSQTYTKQQFYTDVKTNIRLITPRYPLASIVEQGALPYENLKSAVESITVDASPVNVAEYEYQIKMFAAIVKSALREGIKHIKAAESKDSALLCSEYLSSCRQIIARYGGLKHSINNTEVSGELLNYFNYGEEFICSMMIGHLGKLHNELDKQLSNETLSKIGKAINDLIDYKRKMGYPEVSVENDSVNDEMVFRQGVLKKYVESDLYLNAQVRKDGVLVEQIYYSLAAGLAMLFATIVSFAFQRRFGSLTMPLFVALILSYMLKDRIKELMRFYFAHRLGQKYFDNKTTLSIKNQVIGNVREGVDFITDKQTPPEVREIRGRSHLVEAQNRIWNEKIILYRKSIIIDSELLALCTPYYVDGLNDITRLNFLSFTRQMDNPDVWLRLVSQDGELTGVTARKLYYINIIMQFKWGDEVDYKRFRIAINRNGISEIKEVK